MASLNHKFQFLAKLLNPVPFQQVKPNQTMPILSLRQLLSYHKIWLNHNFLRSNSNFNLKRVSTVVNSNDSSKNKKSILICWKLAVFAIQTTQKTSSCPSLSINTPTKSRLVREMSTGSGTTKASNQGIVKISLTSLKGQQVNSKNLLRCPCVVLESCLPMLGIYRLNKQI